MNKVIVACDLGASSGRVFFSRLEEDNLVVKEIHRFPNEPYEKYGRLYWDIKKIVQEIEIGIKKIIDIGFEIISIGFDSWGVDYAWIDKNGELLEDPICYRDSGDKWKDLDKKISKFEIFQESGVNFFDFNSIYRINKDKFEERDSLLFLPNLIGYIFTRVKNIEYSIATTSGLINQIEKKYSKKIKKEIRLLDKELPKLVSAGTNLGEITEEKAKEFNSNKFSVINVNCHDTASAIYSIEKRDDETCFLILGTWSIIGIVRDEPILDKSAFELGITNEGIYKEKVRIQHLIPGMWILQRLKKDFKKNNKNYTYLEINKMARESNKNQIIDLEDKTLIYPKSMKKALEELLPKGEYSDGDLLRIAYNSIVKKVENGIKNMERITNKKLKNVVALGGGIQDLYLIERLSCELGLNLEKGYIESSVVGNLKSQYIANNLILEKNWKGLNINFK